MSPELFIHHSAEVDRGASIGPGTSIWGNAHIRSSAVVGADCTIGEHVYLDMDVTIGDRVKVQNRALLFGPSSIGDGCFIGPGACLANDERPRAVTPDGLVKASNDWNAVGVVLREGASIGAMATVLPGVTIGSWALVSAGAVVTRDVPDHMLVVGVPARERGFVCRCAQPLDDKLICSEGHRYERSSGTLRSFIE